jgi:hypothetical protein
VKVREIYEAINDIPLENEISNNGSIPYFVFPDELSYLGG